MTIIFQPNEMRLGDLLARMSGGERIIVEMSGRVLYWDQAVYIKRNGIDLESPVVRIRIDTNVYRKELDKQGHRKKNLRSVSAEDLPDMTFRDVDLQFQFRVEIE